MYVSYDNSRRRHASKPPVTANTISLIIIIILIYTVKVCDQLVFYSELMKANTISACVLFGVEC
jgi:uncharacterized membrane protein YjdF